MITSNGLDLADDLRVHGSDPGIYHLARDGVSVCGDVVALWGKSVSVRYWGLQTDIYPTVRFCQQCERLAELEARDGRTHDDLPREN
jgi:hypothetical protein